MKNIAVVGGGFAGLAACWYLLQNPTHRVTLYDTQGFGNGASRMSAGLLHTFAGKDAPAAWRGEECLHDALELLRIAEQTLDQPIAIRTGILRVALSEQQRESFFERSKQYPKLRWMLPEETQRLIPGLTSAPALFLPDSYTVQPDLYVSGLRKACEKRRCTPISQTVHSITELEKFDVIVLTTGAHTRQIPEASHLALKILKGQIITLSWPKDLPPLPMPLNSEVYIIGRPDKQSCLVGATFERQFSTNDPQPSLAEELLRPKAEALIPDLRGARLLDCRAGLRATSPSHQPFVGRITRNTWILTGLGSKGLLYHAYLARLLAQAIQEDDPDVIPFEVSVKSR